MAISIDDLNSFYDNVLFSDCANSVELIEKQNKTSGLANVYIQFNGKFILIKPEFLKLSEEVFKKIKNKISFRSINDGTILVDYNNKHYIVYIELKSGFNEVCKKAVYQLPISSIKIKSFLRNLSSFNPDDYNEVGLILSYPPTDTEKYDDSNNEMILDRKITFFNQQNNTENIIDKEIRQKGKINISSTDFPDLDQSKLHNDIKFKSLEIYHHAVKSNGEMVDLMRFLN